VEEEQPVRFSVRLNNRKAKKVVYMEDLEEVRVLVERQVYHKIPILKKGEYEQLDYYHGKFNI